MPAMNETSKTLLEQCDSDFEREVLKRLLELGYRVTPQVKVGPFSIDMVVEGDADRRLAIELDGDKYHTPERWAGRFGSSARNGTRRLEILALLGIQLPLGRSRVLC